ncbi:TetR family transcriptional regulator [Brevundimonas sp. LM2]|uniref:TetR/AcrR family transcriptional regulator n=1 Tax=Brevundimonas sp. LM2 TaxID=1938605 RepID=UPI000983CEA1|nr:TetR/AcrR family transcriptional regulator [Brevundimonas sp. LM2]AQR60504.1 TetR family transcriptional regulator [Brevundimonas sp. LM2]
MARVVGQIDERKSEAILDAASALFAEKGAAASMDAIARRAGVSKQTLYNRYGSKVEIGRALAERRSDLITAPLRAGGDPLTVLTALAESMLAKLCSADGRVSMRGVALMSPQAPDLAEAVYHAGPGESLRRLALWLAEQDRQGLIRVPDPELAAEMFVGMTMGHGHLRGILGIEEARAIDIPARARETAQRYLRAFAV